MAIVQLGQCGGVVRGNALQEVDVGAIAGVHCAECYGHRSCEPGKPTARGALTLRCCDAPGVTGAEGELTGHHRRISPTQSERSQSSIVQYVVDRSADLRR
jgi:hypothetical protein